jgi:hypothetical protein
VKETRRSRAADQSSERAYRLDGANRFADPARADLIEVKVQLRDDADIAAGWAVDRDHASMSNWKVLPTQVVLGLMVVSFPDVNVFATNVCRLASTSKIT